MLSLDKLNRTYSISTYLSKDEIINTLKDRIDNANNQNRWLSFEAISYKYIKVDDYRAVIKRKPVLFGSNGGIGVVILHFKNDDQKQTIIEVEVKPLKIALWISAGFLIPFSIFCVWLMHGIVKYEFLILVWILLIGSNFLSIALYRYRLKNYLRLILNDIGIHEELVKSPNL